MHGSRQHQRHTVSCEPRVGIAQPSLVLMTLDFESVHPDTNVFCLVVRSCPHQLFSGFRWRVCRSGDGAAYRPLLAAPTQYHPDYGVTYVGICEPRKSLIVAFSKLVGFGALLLERNESSRLTLQPVMKLLDIWVRKNSLLQKLKDRGIGSSQKAKNRFLD